MDTMVHKMIFDNSMLYKALLHNVYLSRHYVGSMISQLKTSSVSGYLVCTRAREGENTKKYVAGSIPAVRIMDLAIGRDQVKTSPPRPFSLYRFHPSSPTVPTGKP